MARKELNIFGTSFLDLLSGALAAVIILFVVVPKMTVEQQNALEEIEQLNIEMEQLSQLMEQLSQSVPQELYEEIQQQMENIQATIERLTEEVNSLQNHLAQSEAENERLREQVSQLEDVQQQVNDLQEQNRQLQERISQLERERQHNSQNGQGISDGKIFGMNAQLGVVCLWPENVDVDLYVKNLATGEICMFNHKNTSFGNLNEDVISRTSPDDDRYELFYQSRIVPGNYQIYVNIYGGQNSRWNGQAAHVEGYAVMFPGKPNQIKIPFRPITLTQKGQDVVVGTLIVTSNNMTLQ